MGGNNRRLTGKLGTPMQTLGELSLATIRRIDEICDEFERGCREGRTLDLSSFVRRWAEPQRSALVRELILIDFHYAGHRGIHRECRDYLARLPHDAHTVEQAFLEAANAVDGSTLNQSGIKADGTDRSQGIVENGGARPPRFIGRYRVLRQLGSGSFGIVYLALDPELGRQVAIKCPRLGIRWKESHWEMLQREAELAAKLHNQGVVAIYDIGCDESGRPFFVMEYVRGESLKDLLSRGQIEVQSAIKIAIALAEGLECIHKAGLVHRDLKPANVILDDEGAPHIADLGLAFDEQHSTSDELAGTLAYMAPEQVPTVEVNNQSRTIDHRCDIWAFGVMLYEMLVGRRPFDGPTPSQLIDQILHDTPMRPSSVNPRNGPVVTQICMKCLSKSPESRYPSAGAITEELRLVSSIETWTSSWRRKAVLAACILSALAATPIIGRYRLAGNSVTDSATIISAVDSRPEAPTPPVLSYVIKSTSERFADLAAAVTAAPDGGIVEIDADGPLTVDQINVGRRQLTIRAARGRRPVITLADDRRLCLLCTVGDLVLEGLDFRRGTPIVRTAVHAPSVVAVEGSGSLQIKHCRFSYASRRENRGACIRVEASDCAIQDTELYCLNGPGIAWVPSAGAVLSLDNCVAEVRTLAHITSEGSNEVTVRIRRSAVKAQQALIVRGIHRLPPKAKLLVFAQQCRFDVDVVLLQIVPTPGGMPQTLAGVTAAIAWDGKQNVFAVRDTFVRSDFGGQRKTLNVDNLAAWNAFWTAQSGSVEIAASESHRGVDAFDYSIPVRDRLDWIARGDELPPGFVAGVDIDLVGPEGSYSLRARP